MFPIERPRRLRQTENLRRLVRETRLTPDGFIYPVFVKPGVNRQDPIQSMPGIYQWSVDTLVTHLTEVYHAGVRAFLFFGIPATKDARGSEAYDPNGIVQVALRAVKATLPDAVLIADLCLCEYTDHGHCGILQGERVDNDSTLELLAAAAVEQARAGATIVAPSDMMDGRIGKIREALEKEGFHNTGILAYAAKYASSFYGPFRDAVGSKNNLGKANKFSYQMDPANALEALREVELDIQEGADIVMVKPGQPYLDIVYRVKQTFGVPTFVYQVSGEYAMQMAAIEKGWMDEKIIIESLLGMKRAGADAILTYFAKRVAKMIN